MIAYNREWLDNNMARQQLNDALADQCITNAEKEAAESRYPVGFYSPNIFIRIGLLILTVVIATFSFGLLALVFISGSSEFAIGGLSIFFGIVCFGALELMVNAKKHYRSGVDDALLLMAGIAVISGLNIMATPTASANALFILLFAVVGMLRFTDRLMAFIAVIALLALLFLWLSPLGTTAKAVMPFVMMIVAAGLYFVSTKLAVQKKYIHYRDCITIIEITSLVCFYAAGNYFVVREASSAMFQLNTSNTIPFAWLFWILTVSLPAIYIIRGIVKKDSLLIRTGLLLVAATVFTVRYYYHLLPPEAVMMGAGVFLVALSYFLVQLLREPRAGFTAQPLQQHTGVKNIEAIIIAETLQAGPEQQGTRFGGGNFGGGGASSDY
jgi:hypothetical protein